MVRHENIDLRPYNTFGISAKCNVLYKIRSKHELKSIIKATEGPYFILGGGSNMLLTKDQENTILKNEIQGIEIVSENDHEIILKVGGGIVWHDLVIWSINQGFGGLENLSLIPGTVGAAPIQNIGAYGVELEQVFHSLNAIHLGTAKEETFYKADCVFGYRDSVFKQALKGQYFISNVTFILSKKEHSLNTSYGAIQSELEARVIINPTIKDISDVVIFIRQSKLPDPSEIGNSGSFFKNPIISKSAYENLLTRYPEIPSYPVDEKHVKIPAGWLIDKSGWKGKRIGDAGSFEKQALVLVNHGNATGKEILDFAEMIIEDVNDKYGIELTPEVNIL